MEIHDAGAVEQLVPARAHFPTQEAAFEQLFKTHFKKLFAYAFTIVKGEMLAEEMVQNVFYKIWEKKGTVDIQTSVSAYLYRSVYYESINHLKHLKVRDAYQKHAASNAAYQDNAATRVQLSELQKELETALSELPEQCRTIFQMSRFEELKYQEIADKLGLSIKTIENQMGKALRILRIKLADYLPLIIALLLENINPETFC
ncbi:MAG: RNA polymerase sigma-70 factor [Chitinophagaceae bacterium]|nr:RNA polymerase sigma-70 factor [Chitinophagaceae bacterium]